MRILGIYKLGRKDSAMSKLRWISAIILVPLLLSTGSLFIKRMDYSSCDVPENINAGATYCQTYGPRSYIGWPLKTHYLSSAEVEERYGSDAGDYRRGLAFLTLINFLFYLVIISCLAGIYKGINKHASTRH